MTTSHEARAESCPPTRGMAPGGLPLLGHALPLRRRPLEFLAALPAQGDLVEVRLGPRRMYLACHPDLVQQVLRDSRTFDKGGPMFDKVRLLTGNGLATSCWAEHRRQRRLVQPAFHQERMAGYAAVMDHEITSMLDSWQEGRVLDVHAAMQALTARVIVRTLFSTRIEDWAVDEIQRCLPVITRGFFTRMVAPLGLMEKLPTRRNREFDRALERMRNVIDQTVSSHPTGTDHGDLLSSLLGAEDEETGERLAGHEIHDQVMTLLMGAIETTSNTLAWTYHLLGENPETEARLHREIDSVLPGRRPGFDDLPHLGYTQRVVTEALRLYPPTWLLTRSTTCEAELAGLRLAPGTTVALSFYALGHNPALFSDPERFDPDRWLPERAKTVPRGAWNSFGGGSRKCIGDRFATIETTLVLAAVASGWRLKPHPGPSIRPEPKASLSTGPLPMIPERRRQGSSAPPGPLSRE
ncbi:cytochrome P450 [Streptomyces cupreus]|uniref:Cytochrome P450 n=1 Tax=Streptomyces cupreus TaxID=2759956 RepID=A0A7X1IY40_9ACTN|nr:cytochrome P450 [Streptomyces cupreus]MBC2900539.1 cytochrome P450 [Streptomyces cupreus]